MKKQIYIIVWMILLVLIGRDIFSQSLPVGDPEKLGFSKKRLERMDHHWQNYIDREKLPGIVTLIARHGKVAYFKSFGNMGQDRKMKKNTIFRIASMTKPIVSVAVLMLYEEGHFMLNDPVSDYIPEFKNMKVFRKMENGKMVTEKLKRPVTVHDLLTHTSGLTYGFFSNTEVDKIIRRTKLWNGTNFDMVKKLSAIPLLFQPGTKWNYGLSTDVLGYFIEAVSGQSLDTFVKNRIFKPLKMVDTDFYVAGDRVKRAAALYHIGKDGKLLLRSNKIKTKRPKFFSGGGGLYSTASDYARFCQMLLNLGELDGIRLLGKLTVKMMIRNHLPDNIKKYSWRGFGLGVAMVTDVTQYKNLGSEGMYFWSGIDGTHFWIDPEEKLFGILMTRYTPFRYYPIESEIKTLTYQAIVD